MSSFSVAFQQSKYLLLSQRRNFQAAFFTVIFPLVLFVFFSSVFGEGENARTTLDGNPVATKTYFLGGMMAYAITSAAFTSICIRAR